LYSVDNDVVWPARMVAGGGALGGNGRATSR
jgi:hypothetical protein